MSSGYHFYFCRILPLALLLLCTASPSAAESCLECHTEIFKQFRSNSHHIQGIETSSRHCYACHWEATADGLVSNRYHRGDNPQVDLVVWVGGKRPVDHVSGKTAATFTPAAIGTDRERSDVAGVTVHCISCHNDDSLQAVPFAGDPNTPATYAWDRESIAARYSSKETTSWGKYSTATSNRKMQVTKALSAHGNAVANEGGWKELIGYDGEMPHDRGGKGARNVECFDCHNSHGSSVAGVTSSYPALDSRSNGGILKETIPGQSGYKTSYQPSVNSYSRSKNPFNPGAGLCFDCHETAAAGATPWGYSSTFGAAKPIMGYKDSAGFGDGIKGSSGRLGGRQGKGEISSSHLKAGTPLQHPSAKQINGLCTPCHDPHGVSRTLGSKMGYAVPLLKGSWLTSPYREDGPPDKVPARRRSGIDGDSGYNAVNRESGSNLAGTTDYNRVNRDAGSNLATDADYNRVNRDTGSNLIKSVPDYNKVNRDAGSNLAKEGTDYNRVNRDAGSNFAKDADYNRVNRDAGSNLIKAATDYNKVNRDAGSNLAKEGTDYNRVNRDAGSNFAKDADYNRVNRDAGSNFGKDSTDFNRVNRDSNSNLAKASVNTDRETDANSSNRDANSNFAKSSSGAPREPLQGMKYHMDRDTFGNARGINEGEDKFAGLCLGCHKKENLTGTAASGSIHRTVKGWGSNKEHSFPCSKCHQAHNSGLPRLMQTNCFDKGPAGLRDNSSPSRSPFKNEPGANISTTSNQLPGRMVGCHVRQFGRAVSSPESGNWKEVSPW